MYQRFEIPTPSARTLPSEEVVVSELEGVLVADDTSDVDVVDIFWSVGEAVSWARMAGGIDRRSIVTNLSAVCVDAKEDGSLCIILGST